MDDDPVRGKAVRLDRAANAVQHVITVRLHEDLHSGAGNVGHELPHQCLAGGMEMDFRILHQEDVPLRCRQGGDYDGQALREAEPRMGRKMKARVVRSPQAQRHDVRPGRLLQVQRAAREEGAHALLDLSKAAGRCVRQCEIGRYGFVPAPMQHAHRVLAPRSHDVDDMGVLERVSLLWPHPLGSDVRQIPQPPSQRGDRCRRLLVGG